MVGFFISLGIASAIIAKPFVRKALRKEKCAASNSKDAKELAELRRHAEYNLSHMTSAEPLQLSPNWWRINDFIKSTRFRFWYGDDAFVYRDYDKGMIMIPRSDFDGDTLKLLEELIKDAKWFCDNPTDVSINKRRETMTAFLREKYPGLSESSVLEIVYNIW